MLFPVKDLAPDAIVAYLALITSLSALLLQGVKIVFIDPRMTDSKTRDWTLRVIGGVITFGLLTLFLVTHNSFDGKFVLDYIAYALGLQTLAHTGFQIITTVSTPKSADVPSDSAPPFGSDGQPIVTPVGPGVTP